VNGTLNRVCDILILVLRRMGARDEDALNVVAGKRDCNEVALSIDRLP